MSNPAANHTSCLAFKSGCSMLSRRRCRRFLCLSTSRDPSSHVGGVGIMKHAGHADPLPVQLETMVAFRRLLGGAYAMQQARDKLLPNRPRSWSQSSDCRQAHSEPKTPPFLREQAHLKNARTQQPCLSSPLGVASAHED